MNNKHDTEDLLHAYGTKKRASVKAPEHILKNVVAQITSEQPAQQLPRSKKGPIVLFNIKWLQTVSTLLVLVGITITGTAVISLSDAFPFNTTETPQVAVRSKSLSFSISYYLEHQGTFSPVISGSTLAENNKIQPFYSSDTANYIHFFLLNQSGSVECITNTQELYMPASDGTPLPFALELDRYIGAEALIALAAPEKFDPVRILETIQSLNITTSLPLTNGTLYDRLSPLFKNHSVSVLTYEKK
ncbi:MAG: hypothetical protein OCC49_19345 [Fibrobacterales bacterium]